MLKFIGKKYSELSSYIETYEKGHYIENNNIYNHKYLFIQADSIKHGACLDIRDLNFTRSLYFSVEKLTKTAVKRMLSRHPET